MNISHYNMYSRPPSNHIYIKSLVFSQSHFWHDTRGKTTNTSKSYKCSASSRTQPEALDQPAHLRQRGQAHPGLVNTHTLRQTHTHRSNESQLWMVAWYSKTTINVEEAEHVDLLNRQREEGMSGKDKGRWVRWGRGRVWKKNKKVLQTSNLMYHSKCNNCVYNC